jgi:hypothetical protein
MNNGSNVILNVNTGNATSNFNVPGNSVISILWGGLQTKQTVISAISQTISTELNLPFSLPLSISGNPVSKLELFSGNNLIGVDSIAPYNFSWIPAKVGTYALTCKAYGSNYQPANSLLLYLTVYEYKSIPGKVRAEVFDNMSGVRLENCNDLGGGLDAGYLNNNSFLDYLVDVKAAGRYRIGFRIAGMIPGSARLSVAGKVLVDTIHVPYTGGYQNWSTVTDTAYLTKGRQTFHFNVTALGWNFNYMDFALIDTLTGVNFLHQLSADFNIYPNPHTSCFYVKDIFQTNPSVSIRILNTMGEIVKQMEYLNEGNSNDVRVETDGLPQGIYFLKIQQHTDVIYKMISKMGS